MKNFLSLIAILTLSLQPSFSAIATAPLIPSSDVKTVILRQATTLINLEHKVYGAGTGGAPGVCYREVQHGTRQSCSTQTQHQCTNVPQNQCHSEAYPVCRNVQQNVCNQVSFPVCQSVPRNECTAVPRQVCESVPRNQCETVNNPVCMDVPEQVCSNNPVQECHDTEVPVCTSVPRSVCETTQACETVQDSVCHGEVCQTVPRRDCKPVESCHQVSDSVCHNESRNSCSMVDHQSCHTENRRQCHNEGRQECHVVPDSVCHTVQDSVCHAVQDSVCHNETRQQCHLENQSQCHDEYRQVCGSTSGQQCTDVPQQVCQTVPNMVSEPYACNQPNSGGRVLKSHTTADVKIVVVNFNQATLKHDIFKLVLSSSDVKLSLAKASNKVVLHVLHKEQQVLNISGTEKHFSVIYTIEVLSPKQARLTQGLAREELLNPGLLDQLNDNTAVLPEATEEASE